MNNQLTEDERKTGWRLLFDGETLNGWQATGKATGWAVEDGAIACTVQGGGYLATVGQYEDFELMLDFRIAPKGNSGVFIRWSNLKDPVNSGLEVQILDTYGEAELRRNSCGAIYDLVAPAVQACRPAGEWNTYHIVCQGPHISVSLNGQHIASMNVDLWTEPHRNPDGTSNKFPVAWAAMPRRGYIGLQDHGGRVWFRNIKLKEL